MSGPLDADLPRPGLLTRERAQFLRYAGVGACTTLLDLTLFTIFAVPVGMPALLANVCSTCITVCFSYLANRILVFRSDAAATRTFVQFVAVTLFSGLLVQSVIIWTVLRVGHAAAPDLRHGVLAPTAKVAAMGVGMVSNYLGYRWLFGRDEGSGERRATIAGVLRREAPPAAVALLLATFLVTGASFDATNSGRWFTADAGAAIGSVLAGLLIAVGIFVVLRFGYRAIDTARAAAVNASAGGVIPMRRALRAWFWKTYAVIVLAWGGWFALHYPGQVDSDTVTQLFEWLGVTARTDHHPWFDTVVFGGFWSLGHGLGSYNLGLFLYNAVQLLVTAAAMSAGLVYLGRCGLSRRARIVLTGVVALVPIFPSAATSMSKDSFAVIFFILFLLVFIELVRTRVLLLRRGWLLAGFVADSVVLILAKRTNIYLVVLALVVLLVLAARGARVRLIGAGLATLFLTNVLWSMVLLPAWGIGHATSQDMFTIPVQQTARTVVEHGSALPPAERASIDRMLRYRGLAAAYDPRRSDPVKGRIPEPLPGATVRSYGRTWFAEGMRYPATYLAATYNNTYDYFYPGPPLPSGGSINTRKYLDFWQSRAEPGTSRARITSVADEIHSSAKLTGVRAGIDRFAGTGGTMNELPGVGLLTSKALYCSWIPLMALGYAVGRRRWFLVVAAVPIWVNLLFLVAGPIALGRYIYPMLYGSVILAGLLLCPVRVSARTPEASTATPG